MLVFRIDASAKSGFQPLAGSVYLASLLKKYVDMRFCINRDKAVVKFLQDKKIPLCQPENLFKKPVQSLLFYVEDFTPADRELLLRAKKDGIKTVRITAPGRKVEETGCDYLLSGPAYAILHHRFRHFNGAKRKYRKRVKNILISLEEAVEYRELRDIIDLLHRQRFNIKIALTSHTRRISRKILKRLYPGLRFVGNSESLARPFFEADTALIVPGIAAYEAAAAGTPALYLSYGKDRESCAEFFEKENLGIKISKAGDIVPQVGQLSLERRITMGSAGKSLVDAKGAYRIIDFLKEKGII